MPAGFIFAIQQKSITGPMWGLKLSVEVVRTIVLFLFLFILFLKNVIFSITNSPRTHAAMHGWFGGAWRRTICDFLLNVPLSGSDTLCGDACAHRLA